MALISDEHADSMTWGNDAAGDEGSDTGDETDRLFTFEVMKSNEQEESVTVRPGFTVSLFSALSRV